VSALKLRPEVEAFAQLMEQKLRENDHKGGWDDCDVDWLLTRMDEESRELAKCRFEEARAIVGVGPYMITREGRDAARRNIGAEAADVANFAMMIADVCGALRRPTPPPQAAEAPKCECCRSDAHTGNGPCTCAQYCGNRTEEYRPAAPPTAPAGEGNVRWTPPSRADWEMALELLEQYADGGAAKIADVRAFLREVGRP
jgi:hypothetical protein